MTRTGIRLLSLLAVLALSSPTWAQAQSRRGHWGEEQVLRFRAGIFTPRGDSSYWTDKSLDFNGDADDFEDTVYGLDYVRFLGGRLGLMASTTLYEGSSTQSYLDFVDVRGGEIRHGTELDIVSLDLGLVWNLARRDARIIPYVGIGGGFYAWNLTEAGDFIDFDTADLEIFSAGFETDGTTFGTYWQAGVEVPLASNWSVFFDTRWRRAKDNLEGDFDGLGELDLSGKSITFGAAFSY